ncbi:MAG: L,D-transpeptidase [Actinobacteria bacterium]|nr:L,D-transpeptidase [Actinomycetota bacterium]
MRKTATSSVGRLFLTVSILCVWAFAAAVPAANADDAVQPQQLSAAPTAPAGATSGGQAVIAPAIEPTAAKRVKKHASSPSNGLPTFKISIGDAYPYRGHRYVLPRARVEISGEVDAALDGQTITVRISKNGRTVKSESVKLDQRGGKSSFSFHFRTGKKGKYLVDTELSPEIAALANAADTKSVTVVKTSVHRGSSGVAVRVFQNKLAGLHYVVPRGGHFDAATGRAFVAFRKVTGMARVESGGYKMARKLAEGRGGFKLRHPKAGRHVEVSIGRQVMAFADNGHVVRVYHVSTGAPGTPTVRGTFHVYRKDPGTNAKGMVKSNYFIRGYAIHGYASVPPYNASHGCVRVPVPNAASIYAWVHMGTRVDVY